ncbi:acylphosphatase [Sediminibacillus halophilus]|uniref:acylphosphatase n=1 Tax=Sediminibacillus halophilus TaxID=482461 RepID=A0A1G9M3Q4_9BACI|nr:acylphosphatase [Sediminibacillus halophilus]SDL68889.1 acylphosphatase [Sediminibacillus halophilus]
MTNAYMIAKGNVQGVGFRATAQQKAMEIGVKGWVRNLPNGDVELEAEGTDKQVDKFIEIIREGPHRFISVDHLDIEKSKEEKGYGSFEVRY